MSFNPVIIKPKKEVCPICWRGNCKLFLRMQDLRFTDEERTKFFLAFHRDVCVNCRKLSCRGCSSPRKFARDKKRAPDWWKGEHN